MRYIKFICDKIRTTHTIKHFNLHTLRSKAKKKSTTTTMQNGNHSKDIKKFANSNEISHFLAGFKLFALTVENNSVLFYQILEHFSDFISSHSYIGSLNRYQLL